MTRGNNTVELSAEIAAQPAVVWRALTDPDITEQYFYNARIESRWTSGSPIVFRSRFLGFIRFTLRGEIVRIVPERELQYKLFHHRFFGKPSRSEHSLVTMRLSSSGRSTRLTIADDVGSTKGAERRYARSVKGWKKIVEGLAHVVASDATRS